MGAVEAGSGGSGRRLAHVPALDGLRGLAVVAVLLFHAGYLRGGWLGVDLFFVLSGYLITSLLLVEQRDAGRIDVVAFWGRRAQRLLPALLVVVAAASLYAWLALDAVDLGAVRADGLATLAFVANWHDLVDGGGYWDLGAAPSLFRHTWSLAVEEQLYLVWPLLVGLVIRHRRGRSPDAVARFALAVAAASAALALGLHAAGASAERIYFGTDTRAVALALGAFVAGWRRRRGAGSPRATRWLEGAAAVATVVLGVAWWGLEGSSSSTYRGGLVGASVLGAVVVAAAADERGGRLASLFSLAPLRALGLVSYGLYLWHWPIYVALSPARTGWRGPGLLALRLAVTGVAAALSWFLVEQPVRRGRPLRWWSGRRGAATAAAGVAVAAVVLVVATLGAVSVPEAELASGVRQPSATSADRPDVLVVGDSVAASLAEPAIADPAAYGVDVARATELGCQAVWDGQHRARGVEGEVTTPAACPPGVADLVATDRPDAVVVLYGGWTNADYEIDGAWRSACDEPYRAALEARFTEVVEAAGSSGAPVVVVDAARSTNAYRQDDTWERTACTNAVSRSVAEATPGTSFLSLDAWLCPEGTCRTEADGVDLRSDGVHFQGPGGATATRWLLGEVARVAGLALPATTTDDPQAEAIEVACRWFVQLRALTSPRLPEIVGSTEGRAAFDEALAAVDGATVERLDAEAAADLAPMAGDRFQGWIAATLDGLAAGRPFSPADVPADITATLDRGTDRLEQLC